MTMAVCSIAMRVVLLVAWLAPGACSSGGSAPKVPDAVAPTPVSTPPDELQFTTLTTHTLDADGDQSGLDACELMQQDTFLKRQNRSMVTGEWLEAYCRVTFSESGSLGPVVTRMSDDEVIFNYDGNALDLWRGEDASDFVRPKHRDKSNDSNEKLAG